MYAGNMSSYKLNIYCTLALDCILVSVSTWRVDDDRYACANFKNV